MIVELTRDSIVGVGTIERHPVEAWQGDASKCGSVVALNAKKAGERINLKEDAANRMLQLGSAKIPDRATEQATKKAA